jgi:Reverse transcriptase (RNA-dependent DNA polymerase)
MLPTTDLAISYLSFNSKLVDRVIVSQFVNHAEINMLFSAKQSTYGKHHSMETALTRVFNHIVFAADSGRYCCQYLLLCLRSAFDTVENELLLETLYKHLSLDGSVLPRFRSYFSERTQSNYVVNDVVSLI